MKEYKIVFTGAVGAGKTTAISTITNDNAVSVDVRNTDSGIFKAATTVGLDFGALRLGNGDRLRLFGTPGQTRFDFMWKILTRNALGIIILVDNSRSAPLADLDLYLSGFSDELHKIPCVIGVGRHNTHPEPSLDDYANFIERYSLVIPILNVDVRIKKDVLLLLDTLITLIESDCTTAAYDKQTTS